MQRETIYSKVTGNKRRGNGIYRNQTVDIVDRDIWVEVTSCIFFTQSKYKQQVSPSSQPKASTQQLQFKSDCGTFVAYNLSHAPSSGNPSVLAINSKKKAAKIILKNKGSRNAYVKVKTHILQENRDYERVNGTDVILHSSNSS